MQRSSHGGRSVHGVIEEGYRADLIVENNVERKSLETLFPVLAPFPRCRALGRVDARQYGGSSGRQKRWPEVKIILPPDSGFCQWKMYVGVSLTKSITS